VAHASNPSYSGGRDQFGSKPTQANSSTRPCLETPFKQKIGLVEWLKVKAMSSNPSTAKKVVIASTSGSFLYPSYSETEIRRIKFPSQSGK
jgi:hypothetical protein